MRRAFPAFCENYMAYLVLGLGIVMAVVGAVAIAGGYPMIQYERGWSSVIAGSALLAGGVITVSLGIAVRALADIKMTLLAGAVPRAPAAEYAETNVAAPARQTSGMAMPVAVAAIPAAATAVIGHEALDAYAQVPPAYQQPAYQAAPRETPAYSEHAVDHAPVHHDEPVADGYAMATPATPEHDLVAPEPAVPVSVSPVSVSPAPVSPVLAAPVSGGGGAPPGDWLDRAFSELDLHVPDHAAPRETAPLTPAAALEPDVAPPYPAEAHHEPVYQETAHSEPAPYEPDHDARAHDALHAEHELHADLEGVHPATGPGDHPAPVTTDEHAYAGGAEHAETIHAVEPEVLHHDEAAEVGAHAEAAAEPVHAEVHHAEPAPAAAAPEPVAEAPIIGRYEADGTSYTMYADGSIAAQSSAGVYRFKSMAELKSFIEG